MGFGKECKNSPTGKHQMKAHQWEHGNKGEEGYKILSVLYCHWCGKMPKNPPRGFHKK